LEWERCCPMSREHSFFSAAHAPHSRHHPRVELQPEQTISSSTKPLVWLVHWQSNQATQSQFLRQLTIWLVPTIFAQMLTLWWSRPKATINNDAPFDAVSFMATLPLMQCTAQHQHWPLPQHAAGPVLLRCCHLAAMPS